MAKDYFAPYGTYSFSSSLSPEELEKRLESACREWLPLWSRDFRKFFFFRWGSRIVLTPCCLSRNTLRACLRLTVEPAAAGGGSHIQVVAAPLNMRWFEWFCYGFCILVLAGVVVSSLFQALISILKTLADPEDALHRACDKYADTFRKVETLADKPLAEYTEEELVALWKAAKAQRS